MICPICKSEYRDGFDECSDCNVKLVDEEIELEYKESFVKKGSKKILKNIGTFFKTNIAYFVLSIISNTLIGAVGLFVLLFFLLAISDSGLFGMPNEPDWTFAIGIAITYALFALGINLLILKASKVNKKACYLISLFYLATVIFSIPLYGLYYDWVRGI